MDRRNAQMHRAAQLYYLQDLNQKDISESLGVSRPTVSRLLTEARATGVVKISIDHEIPIDSDLSQRLRLALGVRDAIVVSGDEDVQSTLAMVGRAGAELVHSVVEPGTTVAISWGNSMAHLVAALEDVPTDGVEVVQMVGSLGEGNPDVDGPDLARRFALRFGGTYRYVHAPAVFRSAELCEELRSQPQIAETFRRANLANVCITSVGSVEEAESSLGRNGYFSGDERAKFASQGAVGHLLAKLIDEHGNEFDEYNARVLSTPLKELRDRPWSICVAAGAKKALPLLGAVRAGYINALVVDDNAARAILHNTEQD